MNRLKKFTYIECTQCNSKITYNSENNNYICNTCQQELQFNKSFCIFDKQSFIEQLLSNPKMARNYIVSFMRWNNSSDNLVSDPNLIDAYYNEILQKKDPLSNYKLFEDFNTTETQEQP